MDETIVSDVETTPELVAALAYGRLQYHVAVWIAAAGHPNTYATEFMLWAWNQRTGAVADRHQYAAMSDNLVAFCRAAVSITPD